MSYQDTIDYLFGLQKHGIKFGLFTSRQLMSALGNPQERFRSVHIAGTNGKGSTAAFLASMLKAAGRRVGLYTSPHLVSFTERIRIDGVQLTEQRVIALADRVRSLAAGIAAPDGREPVTPTFFEVTTAMAFDAFAEEGVDIAVVETGMGGRLDSTNVITPLVSVITNIDLEHTEFLGTTVEQIASEKAGIIKRGVPVVTGAVQPEAIAVIAAAARRHGSRLYRMPEDFGPAFESSGRDRLFAYRGIRSRYEDLAISLRGPHQAGNASLALAAVECLADAGIAVPENALRSGLAGTRWEGRLEQVAAGPDIFLDGAHNPASAAVLAAALRDLRRNYDRLVLVLGILQDKDHRGIVRRLAPLADSVVATRPRYHRALDADALAGAVRPFIPAVSTAGTVEEAVAIARGDAGERGLVVVTGSLYTVGDARELLCARTAGGGLQGLKG